MAPVRNRLKLATLCYVKRGGKTLMIHRVGRPRDIHRGKWNGLGGKLIPGESPEEGVIREVREESGLQIQRPRWKGCLTFPGFNGEDDWYVWVFVARRFQGSLRESSEGPLAWVADKDLLRLPMWEGDRLFLPWINGRRFFSGQFVYRAGRLHSHRVFFY